MACYDGQCERSDAASYLAANIIKTPQTFHGQAIKPFGPDNQKFHSGEGDTLSEVPRL